MSRVTARNTWIETGYEQFAAEGLDGIQVERLARITRLNKSGYYHYFGDRDIFLEQLLRHHEKLALRLIDDYKSIEDFESGFPGITLKFKNAILFHMQLVRYRQVDIFYKIYHRINLIVDKEIVRTFSKFVGLEDNPDLAYKYFMHARDMFYSRITPENLDESFLKSLMHEVREVVQLLIKQTTEARAE